LEFSADALLYLGLSGEAVLRQETAIASLLVLCRTFCEIDHWENGEAKKVQPYVVGKDMYILE